MRTVPGCPEASRYMPRINKHFYLFYSFREINHIMLRWNTHACSVELFHRLTSHKVLQLSNFSDGVIITSVRMRIGGTGYFYE